MKIDTLGNVLWHQLIHAPTEGVFRNLDISVVDGGYVWSGAKGVAENTSGRLERISQDGELEWFIQNSNGSGAMRHALILDTIITAEAHKYADYENSSNPQFAYSYLRLSYLDVNLETLVNSTDIQVGEPWVSNGVFKILQGNNDAYVISGTFYEPVDSHLELVSYILQVDENFQLDWYTKLSYSQCPSCENILYDMEIAPDGGYVMVGSFRDYDVSFNERTWLVKVDACGDLEWQGCAPVGIGEFKVQDSRLRVYPNPASNHVLVASPLGAGGSGGW